MIEGRLLEKGSNSRLQISVQNAVPCIFILNLLLKFYHVVVIESNVWTTNFAQKLTVRIIEAFHVF